MLRRFIAWWLFRRVLKECAQIQTVDIDTTSTEHP